MKRIEAGVLSPADGEPARDRWYCSPSSGLSVSPARRQRPGPSGRTCSIRHKRQMVAQIIGPPGR